MLSFASSADEDSFPSCVARTVTSLKSRPEATNPRVLFRILDGKVQGLGFGFCGIAGFARQPSAYLSILSGMVHLPYRQIWNSDSNACGVFWG